MRERKRSFADASTASSSISGFLGESMNQATPPTSHRQVPEAVAEQLVADAAHAITAWVNRTREHGLRIPIVSRLFERLTQTE